MIYREKNNELLHEHIGTIKQVWQVKSGFKESKYITAVLNSKDELWVVNFNLYQQPGIFN